MIEIYGLPQSLTGLETVTIHQEQNGNIAKCTMPLSMLISLAIESWIKNLPTSEPTTAGIAWNNTGVVSIS